LKTHPTLISEYLISQNSNQLDGLVNEIQTLIVLNGHSVSLTQNESDINSNITGRYKN
jgi:hypothetical protein